LHILAYTEGWADLIVLQMAARYRSENPARWGYACLCIGPRFEETIERHYEEVDILTGDSLHIFSLLPPPQQFLDQRLLEIDQLNTVGSADLKNRLERLVRSRHSLYAAGDVARQAERAHLLYDLREQGMAANHRTDFIFLDFRVRDDETHIDVVAAQEAPGADSLSHGQCLDIFEKMGRKAHESSRKGLRVDDFVRQLNFEWSSKIALAKATDLGRYLVKFLKLLLGGVK
jgi:hypothetical protein